MKFKKSIISAILISCLTSCVGNDLSKQNHKDANQLNSKQSLKNSNESDMLSGVFNDNIGDKELYNIVVDQAKKSTDYKGSSLTFIRSCSGVSETASVDLSMDSLQRHNLNSWQDIVRYIGDNGVALKTEDAQIQKSRYRGRWVYSIWDKADHSYRDCSMRNTPEYYLMNRALNFTKETGATIGDAPW